MLAAAACAAACSETRVDTSATPTWSDRVGPLLRDRCAGCHGGDHPAAGWRASGYLEAIACVPSGQPATTPADASAPIVRAMDAPPHQGMLDASERAELLAWAAAGAPAFATAVHPPQIIDPRSPDFHGARLRANGYRAMLDARDPMACGFCHAGAPDSVTSTGTPGAPSCTSCHDAPRGVLACGTCHGDGKDRASPPRDPCFHPDEAARQHAHTAHVEPRSTHARGFPCSTCHPTPSDRGSVLGGTHGDGVVEVAFDPKLAGANGTWDPATGACAVRCHDRGGARPRPMWPETTSMGCGDCHGAPPAGHFRGACSSCHREANAEGTALSGGPLHLDGVIEVGDGSGKCGACHGRGDDPWPTTAAHPAHEQPASSAPVACLDCHPARADIATPGHLDGVVEVTFSGIALARGSMPAWNGTTCDGIACHGGGLPDPVAAPAWRDVSGGARACGACHGLPPTQHTPSKTCDRAECHAGEVVLDARGVPSITAQGEPLHVDGISESNR